MPADCTCVAQSIASLAALVVVVEGGFGVPLPATPGAWILLSGYFESLRICWKVLNFSVNCLSCSGFINSR